MSVIPMRVRPKPRATAIRKARRVYAIAFDLDGPIALDLRKWQHR
jgi:hypothetical protein